jgi:hypothetical protein
MRLSVASLDDQRSRSASPARNMPHRKASRQPCPYWIVHDLGVSEDRLSKIKGRTGRALTFPPHTERLESGEFVEVARPGRLGVPGLVSFVFTCPHTSSVKGGSSFITALSVASIGAENESRSRLPPRKAAAICLGVAVSSKPNPPKSTSSKR